MLSKENRLLKEKDFIGIFQHGRLNYSRIGRIKLRKNQLRENRFAIIISNKVTKKAVSRNKIKRQIRAIIKSINHQLKPANDILIIASSKILGQKYSEIEQALKDSFKELKLLSDKVER